MTASPLIQQKNEAVFSGESQTEDLGFGSCQAWGTLRSLHKIREIQGTFPISYWKSLLYSLNLLPKHSPSGLHISGRLMVLLTKSDQIKRKDHKWFPNQTANKIPYGSYTLSQPLKCAELIVSTDTCGKPLTQKPELQRVNGSRKNQHLCRKMESFQHCN